MDSLPNPDPKNDALVLVAHGCPVFPVHSVVNGKCTCGKDCGKNIAKHPRTDHGLHDASSEAEQITKWWTKFPNANIGIATGAALGAVVIDIDPRHGGNESLAALLQEHGELPATVESLTGGGGRHFLFAHPGGTVGNRSGVRDGIDVRGDGGYIIAPPSIHASGNRYCWREGAAPWEIALAPLPAWLRQLIEKPAAPVTPPSGQATPGDDRFARCLQSLLRIRTPDANDGSKRLFAAACRCVEHSLSELETVACIRAYEAAKPFPKKWTDAEIVVRFQDAGKRTENGSALNKSSSGKNSGGDGERGPAQAQQLIELTGAAELWHTPAGDCYATVTVGEHAEHAPVRSRQFRLWLEHEYFQTTGGAPNAEARASALSVIEARARFEGAENAVHLRAAPHGENIFVDLCDRGWHGIEVTANGWRVVANPPVRFRRAKAMLPLPMPVAGGSISELRKFVNVSDEHFPLVVAWLVATLRPIGPYPVLSLHGEQGSGKSNQARMLRSLVDPNTAPIRSEPKEPRDLMIAANNGLLIAVDNLSHVPNWLSDCLCRLSTGGGFSTRTLYENDEETIFDATRPVLLTAIEEVATRGDLIDRSLLVSLPTIPEHKRRPEAELWKEFDEAQPRIFGALLDAVACAIRNLPTTKLDRLPRMADFALWGTAAEPALELQPGEFLHAYMGNRETANETALESEPIAKFIIDVAQGDGWTGTASELLAVINEAAGFERDDGKRRKRMPKHWPKSARSLSGTLKRLAPNLRQTGIEVDFGRTGKSRTRTISIFIADKTGNFASASSASSAERENTGEMADAEADATDAVEILRPPYRPPETCENPEKNGVADAADAKSRTTSASRNKVKL